MTSNFRTPHQYDMIWRATHRDYKGLDADGLRSIMVYRNGTTIVALEDLTNAEFNDALLSARLKIERRA